MKQKVRVVVCAAIRSKDGKVVCGARHYDVAMRDQFLRGGKRTKKWIGAEQGFIDQFCVFMNRQEAYEVAFAAGQVKYGPEHSKGTLYSEDLY